MTGPAPSPAIGTPIYPLIRIACALALLTSGGAGMYLAIVALKPLAAEFGVDRGSASLVYTFHMVGFGLGGMLMGWLSDRIGIALTALLGSLVLAAGYAVAAGAETIAAVWLAHFALIGLLGSAAVFGPLVADISHWFTARRGLAVAIVISGSYFAGAIWPPILQANFEAVGWRETYVGMAWFSVLVMAPLTLIMWRRPPTLDDAEEASANARLQARPLGMSRNNLQGVLCFAGIGCCMAMAVPQVHILAHATDLGYGARHGANMLALMLGCGIISRLTSGWISDRIGGLRTLLLGSAFQGLMIAAFIPFDGLVALYILSVLFGLSQGGIVPSYAIIIRSFFPGREAGWRIGTALTFTVLGMAIGGYGAGALFDGFQSYTPGFIMALVANAANIAIAVALLRRSQRPVPTPG